MLTEKEEKKFIFPAKQNNILLLKLLATIFGL
jgi:hypothetical protein